MTISSYRSGAPTESFTNKCSCDYPPPTPPIGVEPPSSGPLPTSCPTTRRRVLSSSAQTPPTLRTLTTRSSLCPGTLTPPIQSVSTCTAVDQVVAVFQLQYTLILLPARISSLINSFFVFLASIQEIVAMLSLTAVCTLYLSSE